MIYLRNANSQLFLQYNRSAGIHARIAIGLDNIKATNAVGTHMRFNDGVSFHAFALTLENAYEFNTAHQGNGGKCLLIIINMNLLLQDYARFFGEKIKL